MPVRSQFKTDEEFKTAMTDWFAGQALAGALLGEDRHAADKKYQSFDTNRFAWLLRHARDAYAIADTMMSVRDDRKWPCG